MEEIRKDVVGYEGMYQVSNLGRVKTIRFGRDNIMKQQEGNKGYLHICLCTGNHKKLCSVHRLVAKAFIDIDIERPIVNHKDGNKKNNNVYNLERCTQSENLKHTFKYLNRKPTKFRTGKLGKDSPRSKQIQQINKDGELIKIWDSIHDIYREKGWHYSNICNVCKGNRPFANGYIWKYND